MQVDPEKALVWQLQRGISLLLRHDHGDIHVDMGLVLREVPARSVMQLGQGLVAGVARSITTYQGQEMTHEGSNQQVESS